MCHACMTTVALQPRKCVLDVCTMCAVLQAGNAVGWGSPLEHLCLCSPCMWRCGAPQCPRLRRFSPGSCLWSCGKR